MTVAVSSRSQATASRCPVVAGKGFREGKQKSGVLGIRARPTWSGPTEFAYADFKVRVVPCTSALAVRDALRSRGDGTWLVILTDRDERDLGVGITSHLYGGVLRNPDPWDAVRDQFGATRIDRRLVIDPRARDLAAGILAARGDAPWPPARAGFYPRPCLRCRSQPAPRVQRRNRERGTRGSVRVGSRLWPCSAAERASRSGWGAVGRYGCGLACGAMREGSTACGAPAECRPGRGCRAARIGWEGCSCLSVWFRTLGAVACATTQSPRRHHRPARGVGCAG